MWNVHICTAQNMPKHELSMMRIFPSLTLPLYGKIRLWFCLYTEKYGYDSVYIRKNTAMILSIYGKIRLRFCLYTEKFGYDSVYIRKNTATTLSIYGKMRLRLCLYTEKYGYDSVYIRKNTATILSIYGKIGVRESPHFGIFYVRILKKWNFFIRLTSWF